jgi:hypothetical protein
MSNGDPDGLFPLFPSLPPILVYDPRYMTHQLLNFMLGTGPTIAIYPSTNRFTIELQRSKAVIDARHLLRSSVINDCKKYCTSNATGHIFRSAGTKQFIRDLPGNAIYGYTILYNQIPYISSIVPSPVNVEPGVEYFLGSYTGDWSVSKVDCCKGKATLTGFVYNEMSWSSLIRLPWVARNPQSDPRIGPFRTIYMIYLIQADLIFPGVDRCCPCGYKEHLKRIHAAEEGRPDPNVG